MVSCQMCIGCGAEADQRASGLAGIVGFGALSGPCDLMCSSQDGPPIRCANHGDPLQMIRFAGYLTQDLERTSELKEHHQAGKRARSGCLFDFHFESQNHFTAPQSCGSLLRLTTVL